MRTLRLTFEKSSLAAAFATIGITAIAKPEPTMKTTKNKDVAKTEDANSSTPYQPNIIVSVK